MKEPMGASQVKKLIVAILGNGTLSFSGHALTEMKNDKFGVMVETDVVNVLRGGVVQPGELRDGSWRYEIRTPRMAAVIAFRSETHARVVTAWRRTKR